MIPFDSPTTNTNIDQYQYHQFHMILVLVVLVLLHPYTILRAIELPESHQKPDQHSNFSQRVTQILKVDVSLCQLMLLYKIRQ